MAYNLISRGLDSFVSAGRVYVYILSKQERERGGDPILFFVSLYTVQCGLWSIWFILREFTRYSWRGATRGSIYDGRGGGETYKRSFQCEDPSLGRGASQHRPAGQLPRPPSPPTKTTTTMKMQSPLRCPPICLQNTPNLRPRQAVTLKRPGLAEPLSSSAPQRHRGRARFRPLIPPHPFKHLRRGQVRFRPLILHLFQHLPSRLIKSLTQTTTALLVLLPIQHQQAVGGEIHLSALSASGPRNGIQIIRFITTSTRTARPHGTNLHLEEYWEDV